MAKQIKGTDIIEDNHLSNAIQSAEQYLSVVKEIDKTLKKTAQDAKKVAKATNIGRAEDIQKLNTALRQSNATKEASLKLDKQVAAAEAKLAAFDKEREQD